MPEGALPVFYYVARSDSGLMKKGCLHKINTGSTKSTAPLALVYEAPKSTCLTR